MKKTVLIHANYWDGERMCRNGRIEIADGYVDAVYGACDEQNLKPYNIEETCFEDMSGIYLFPAWIDSHLHIPGDFLFEKFGVFTKAELDSRVEIEYETYAKEINIEAKAMIDIATKQIIPAVIRYTTTLAQSISLRCRYQRADRDPGGSIRSSCRHEECAFKIRGSDCTGCSYGTGKRAGSILSR